jgi:hypothetical protein
MIAQCVQFARFLALRQWTLLRTVGTKDAAVSRLWPQKSPAVSTFVEKLASASRHRLALGEAANRAHQERFKENVAHTRFSCAGWKGSPRPKLL